MKTILNKDVVPYQSVLPSFGLDKRYGSRQPAMTDTHAIFGRREEGGGGQIWRRARYDYLAGSYRYLVARAAGTVLGRACVACGLPAGGGMRVRA